MKDPWKITWQEWFSLALVPIGATVIGFGLKLWLPKGNAATVMNIVLAMLPGMLIIITGFFLLFFYEGKRAKERYKVLEAQSASADAYLRQMKTIYPPDSDVLHHIHQLGYRNITFYIFNLENTLRWVTKNYKATLHGESVRDADECIQAAEKLVGK